MKASALIGALQWLIDTHGDLSVLMDFGVAGGGLQPVSEVDLGEEDEGFILWPPDYAFVSQDAMDPRD